LTQPPQLGDVDRCQFGSVRKEGFDQPVDLGQSGGPQVAQRAPQREHFGGGESVHDVEAAFVRLDQTRLPQNLQVGRGVRQALANLLGQLVDRTLALPEQVEQLQTVCAGQRFADRGELGVQTVLERAVVHLFLNYSNELLSRKLRGRRLSRGMPKTLFPWLPGNASPIGRRAASPSARDRPAGRRVAALRRGQ
jgi:hypothetical protein